MLRAEVIEQFSRHIKTNNKNKLADNMEKNPVAETIILINKKRENRKDTQNSHVPTNENSEESNGKFMDFILAKKTYMSLIAKVRPFKGSL